MAQASVAPKPRMVSFSEDDLAKVEAAAAELCISRRKEPGHDWKVTGRYTVKQLLGSGAYGSVCEAWDKHEKQLVAIKRSTCLFEDLIDTKRILREIAILSRLNHPHIVRILDVIASEEEKFNEVYVVLEVCDSDLQKLLRVDVNLSMTHINLLVYNLLVGLKYVHDAGVIHRDLKPANCLVNEDCMLKICDFGLARAIGAASQKADEEGQDSLQNLNRHLTGHVVTRWYRAPELILLQENYSEAIDTWSVACIHAELLGMLPGTAFQERAPLFPGTTCFPLSPDMRHQEDPRYYTKGQQDQLNKVFDLIGTPSESYVEQLIGADARRYIRCFKKRVGKGLRSRFPKADAKTLNLMGGMLRFCPKERIAVAQALEHAVFQEVRSREPKLEQVSVEPISLAFEGEEELTEEFLRNHFCEEMRRVVCGVRTATL